VIVYRVFAHDPAATDGSPGSAAYLHRPQGRGRLDNPAAYDLWYFAVVPEGAIGEVFGDLTEWVDDMFQAPYLPGARRALGRFEVPDDLNILDMDDARTLLDRGLRPTQVVARNRSATQTWALDIFRETAHDGSRKWDGIRWWSYDRPQWPVIGLWVAPGDRPRSRVVGVDLLDLFHPSVLDAATTLARQVRR
jgi:hypothetical protein